MKTNNPQSPKVHYTGVPCGCDRRWSSCFISSIGDLSRVTCGNCRRILTRKTDRPDDEPPADSMHAPDIGLRRDADGELIEADETP